MRVAICDYGAGNVRSVELAFARLGASRRRRRRAPISRSFQASARRAPRWPACARAGSTTRCASGSTRPAGARHLPRPAARARARARRTAASPASASPGPVASPRARAASRASAGREVDPVGDAFYFAHSYAADDAVRDGVGRGHRRRGASAARSSACQFHPEKSGAAGARYLARARGGRMPLPRLIPCLDVAGGRVVKGVQLRGPARRRRPGRARRRLLRRGRRRARLPRHQGDARGARHARRARRAASPSGSRSRSPSAAAFARSRTRTRCCAAGADKVAVNSAALERPELLDRARRARSARRRSSSRSTPRAGACARAPARPRRAPRRGRVGARGAGARRGRDPAHVDRRRRHARGLRPRADRGGRRGGRVPVIASGGAGDARHVADALEVAQAALLASILHEDPARLASLRDELRETGGDAS